MFNRIKMSRSSLMDLSIFTIHYILTKAKIIFRSSFIRRTHIYFITWLPWFSIPHKFSYYCKKHIEIWISYHFTWILDWFHGLHIFLNPLHKYLYFNLSNFIGTLVYKRNMIRINRKYISKILLLFYHWKNSLKLTWIISKVIVYLNCDWALLRIIIK